MAVERKYERDVDILLAEEFSVSPAFASWFLNRTRFRDLSATVVDVFVSRSDNNGESDLIVVFQAEDESRVALLIEDKIDAPLQHEQEKRYRLRAETEVARGTFNDFEIVLCSPKAYVAAQPKAGSFDRFISYEDISDFFRASDSSPRSLYRANFIETAASKSTNTWVRISDEDTNAFWDAAYKIASRDFTILEMKPLQLTKGSTWITFRPKWMPTSPRHIYLSFKGDRGFMDLTISGTLAYRLAEHISAILQPDMTIHQTNKSTAIRLCVEGFKVEESWKVCEDRVRVAFAASERLIRFFQSNRAVLETAAANSLPEQLL